MANNASRRPQPDPRVITAAHAAIKAANVLRYTMRAHWGQHDTYPRWHPKDRARWRQYEIALGEVVDRVAELIAWMGDEEPESGGHGHHDHAWCDRCRQEYAAWLVAEDRLRRFHEAAKTFQALDIPMDLDGFSVPVSDGEETLRHE